MYVCVCIHRYVYLCVCVYIDVYNGIFVCVQLSIPFDKLPDAHLQICFRHVAKAEGIYVCKVCLCCIKPLSPSSLSFPHTSLSPSLSFSGVSKAGLAGHGPYQTFKVPTFWTSPWTLNLKCISVRLCSVILLGNLTTINYGQSHYKDKD